MSFVATDEFSVKITKKYFKEQCLMRSQLPCPIFTSFELNEMSILLKACKRDNTEP